MHNYLDFHFLSLSKLLIINGENNIPTISMIRKTLDQISPNERVLFVPNEIDN